MFKNVEEMTHYEVLEVSIDATTEEIQRAYEKNIALLDDDSLVGYALVPLEDASRWKDQIQQAYDILIDPINRRNYNESLQQQPQGESVNREDHQPTISQDTSPQSITEEHALLFDMQQENPSASPVQHNTPESNQETASTEPIKSLDNVQDIDFGSVEQVTGAMLQQARNSLGISLHEIADFTKISLYYLRCIEEDDFSELPAAVYVKGFIKQYTQYLGISDASVVDKYIVYFKEHL